VRTRLQVAASAAAAVFSITGQVFTAFRTEYRVFQAFFREKSCQ
jgi:hypothetical protein